MRLACDHCEATLRNHPLALAKGDPFRPADTAPGKGGEEMYRMSLQLPVASCVSLLVCALKAPDGGLCEGSRRALSLYLRRFLNWASGGSAPLHSFAVLIAAKLVSTANDMCEGPVGAVMNGAAKGLVDLLFRLAIADPHSSATRPSTTKDWWLRQPHPSHQQRQLITCIGAALYGASVALLDYAMTTLVQPAIARFIHQSPLRTQIKLEGGAAEGDAGRPWLRVPSFWYLFAVLRPFEMLLEDTHPRMASITSHLLPSLLQATITHAKKPPSSQQPEVPTSDPRPVPVLSDALAATYIALALVRTVASFRTWAKCLGSPGVRNALLPFLWELLTKQGAGGVRESFPQVYGTALVALVGLGKPEANEASPGTVCEEEAALREKVVRQLPRMIRAAPVEIGTVLQDSVYSINALATIMLDTNDASFIADIDNAIATAPKIVRHALGRGLHMGLESAPQPTGVLFSQGGARKLAKTEGPYLRACEAAQAVIQKGDKEAFRVSVAMGLMDVVERGRAAMETCTETQ
mmetsp:Transcript_30117/g.87448  ORF Transcript_30117/g.87448 Transcript_30117/m.87448 type:complete len:523 (+) Transcript_30117:191-1759(+)